MKLSERLWHWLFGCRGWIEHEMDSSGVWWIGMRCRTRSVVNDPPPFALSPMDRERET
jgi:hypothetical protein